jgi:cell wall-associated NlpC family hydrolase
MASKLNRRQALAVLSASAVPLALTPSRLFARELGARENEPGEAHRYELKFSYPVQELVGDLEHGERCDPKREAEIPHEHWYTAETRKKFGAWGPEQRRYAPLEEMDGKPTQWKRERVIATAARFIGYEYQHHHCPDWDPPADWPWKECCAGHNGRGVDCSNFTGFVYNQGFGIKMTCAIEQQSELRSALEGHDHSVAVRRIDLPRTLEERRQVLRTGDLVYVRGKETGPVTHVVIWVGDLCRSPGGFPMVMDSHGANVEDDWGNHIPCGIHLRPVREDSWYNKCMAHAHRVFA